MLLGITEYGPALVEYDVVFDANVGASVIGMIPAPGTAKVIDRLLNVASFDGPVACTDESGTVILSIVATVATASTPRSIFPRISTVLAALSAII
jgi:hypothetical protein